MASAVRAVCCLLLNGARQVGKSTLAQQLAQQRGGQYLTLDDPVIAELAASGDPMADDILSAWADKRLVIRKSDDVLFLATPEGDGFFR